MGDARTFSAGFLFCGLGAGALGFLDATARLGPSQARFENVGGVDLDPLSCADFETLTGGQATQADLATMQPSELRAAWGPEAPDCVFLSPPCKGFSRLLGRDASQAPKYQALNRLVLQGINLVLSTWEQGPGVLVIENVPGITTRGAQLLAQVRDLMARDGYIFHEGFHDCGEIGGLAQKRRRFLMVARHRERVPDFIYRPPSRRIKGCGEVLGDLPLPADPAGGALHRLPGISWMNWVRLALIPAGGDWRDLPRAIETQPGNPNAHQSKHRVTEWEKAAGAVTGATRPGSGAPSVADPRIALGATADNAASFKGRPGLMGIRGWDQPLPTVTGSASVSGSNAVAAVCDPRLWSPLATGQARREVFARHGIAKWGEPVGVVAGSGSNGVSGISDPRVALTCSPRAGAYGVLPWEDPAAAVTGSMRIDNRPAAIADPLVVADRPVPSSYGALGLEAALAVVEGRAKPPRGRVPVIISPKDGTWHRPLTTLELAALQGIPTVVNGQALELAGTSVAKWRERIGNAVPVGAGRAIAASVLTSLLAAQTGWVLMPGLFDVWVRKIDGLTHEHPTERINP